MVDEIADLIDNIFAMSLDEMVVLLTANENIHYTFIGVLVVTCLVSIINLSRGL